MKEAELIDEVFEQLEKHYYREEDGSLTSTLERIDRLSFLCVLDTALNNILAP